MPCSFTNARITALLLERAKDGFISEFYDYYVFYSSHSLEGYKGTLLSFPGRQARVLGQ